MAGPWLYDLTLLAETHSDSVVAEATGEALAPTMDEVVLSGPWLYDLTLLTASLSSSLVVAEATAEAPSDIWEPVADDISETTYADYYLHPGVTYEYRVTDAAGNMLVSNTVVHPSHEHAVAAEATGEAPALSAGMSAVNLVVAPATGEAPAPYAGMSSVDVAVVAEATAEVPALSAGMSAVDIVAAEATGEAPSIAHLELVTALVAAATGEAVPIAGIDDSTSKLDTEQPSAVAEASGEAGAPYAAQASVFALVAEAVAEAYALYAEGVISEATAICAEAAGEALPPSYTTFVNSSRFCVVAEATGEALAPSATGLPLDHIDLIVAEATGEALAPTVVIVGVWFRDETEAATWALRALPIPDAEPWGTDTPWGQDPIWGDNGYQRWARGHPATSTWARTGV